MINHKNIANYIQFLYREKYNQDTPVEIIHSWQKLKDSEVDVHLKILYQQWELNEISIKVFEKAFLQSTKKTKNALNWTLIIISILAILGIIIAFLLINNSKSPITNTVTYKRESKNESLNQPQKIESINSIKLSEDDIVNKKDNKEPLKQELIQKLINAENLRNFDEIYACFSPNISRFWDLKHPNHKQLKNRYEHLWKVSNNNFHKIKTINSINSNTLIVVGNYSYYSVKENVQKQIETSTTYIFDSNGLIKEVWGK